MRVLVSTLLYLSLSLGANAGGLTAADLETFRQGDLRKLVVSQPVKVSTQAYISQDGAKATLADHAGTWVLLNFWATWCAPCRHEMPMLDELQSEFGGDQFKVVTIATGRNNPMAMKRFFEDIGVTALPLHTDPSMALARSMGALGLPTTVLINPDGFEVARMRGDADWSSAEAKALIAALVAQ